MPTDQPEPTIELEVKNFGPIAEAKIDLRPLTVFVGPNNTGKSYLATLIYALQIAFMSRYDEEADSWFSIVVESLETAATDDELREIDKWLKDCDRAALTDPPKDNPPPPESLGEAVRTTIAGNSETWTAIVGQISRAFGTGREMRQLVRFSSSRPAEIIVRSRRIDADQSVDFVAYQPTIGRKGGFWNACVSPRVSDAAVAAEAKRRAARIKSRRSGLLRPLRFDSEADWSAALAIVLRLAQDMVSKRFVGLDANAYYLPADRTGIMHANAVVVGALLDAAPYGGFRNRGSTAALSGVVSDFLKEMIVDMSTDVGNRHEIANEIESGIMGGAAIRRPTDAGHPTFAYQPAGQKSEMSLLRVSSMVSELAPVVLYLKHLVDPGDTLIIDEPEAHLHPSAQVEFAIILARLVKSGVRVILTTHSEWILDQFANLVRMSQLPEDERDGLAGSDAALTPEQFGAWLFETKKRPKGTVVREIDIDPDEGGLGRDYFDTAILTHNTWAEIGNRLTKLGLR